MAWNNSLSEATYAIVMLEGTFPTPVKLHIPYLSRPPGFIISDPLWTAKRLLDNTLKLGLDVFGICTNLINIIVFYKIGFNDSITVLFFSLAVSDLGYLIFTLIAQLFDLLETIVGLTPYVRLIAMMYIMLFYGQLFYDISLITTVYTAIQKCCCVAIPLIFKNVFTTFRAGITAVTIYLMMFAYYIPMLVSHGLMPKFDQNLNRTRLSYTYQPYRPTVMNIYKGFNRLFLPFASQAVILLCMVVLTVRLKQSSRIRHNMTWDQYEERGEKTVMNANEIKVVQAVTLVSAIFVVCNLPDVFTSAFSLYYPEFNDYGKYGNAYHFTRAIQDTLAVTNAAINMVVYIKYNSKYRHMLRETFRC